MEIDDASIAVLIFIFEESSLDLEALVGCQAEVLSDCVRAERIGAWELGKGYRDRGRSRFGVRA